MTLSRLVKSLALATGFLAVPLLVCADTSLALRQLLETLVGNGTLTAEQAALIRATAEEKPAPISEASRPSAPTATAAEPKPAPVWAQAKESVVSKLVLSGKLQPQWDVVSVDASSGPAPATRNAFSLRRLELGVLAELTPEWSAFMKADFSSASQPINEAFVTYKGWADTTLNLGHAKTPFTWEEEISDSVIKGVERSPAHRAVVEPSGRGLGSKNSGVHLHRALGDGFFTAASVANAGSKNALGSAGSSSNGLAYYGRLGYRSATAGRFNASVDLAHAPDSLPTGSVTAGAAHLQGAWSRGELLVETIAARYELAAGASTLRTLLVEPTFRLSSDWDLVLRYAWVEGGGAGTSIAAAVRGSAPTGEFDRLDSFYLGGNWYWIGNTLKLTFGYEHTLADDALSGPADENTLRAWRTRLQLLF